MIALRVLRAMFRRAMLKAVQFDVQEGFQAKEIQDVRSVGMLAAEFEIGNPAVSKPFPEETFSPRIILAEEAGHLGRSHDEKVARSRGGFRDHRWWSASVPLTPALSPGEREGGIPSRAGLGWHGNGQWQDAMSPLFGERVSVRGKVALDKAGAVGWEGVSFPLTPTLSPGERLGGSLSRGKRRDGMFPAQGPHHREAGWKRCTTADWKFALRCSVSQSPLDRSSVLFSRRSVHSNPSFAGQKRSKRSNS